MAGERKIELKELFAIFYVSVILLTVILMIFSFPIGLYTVFFTKLSNGTISQATVLQGISLYLGLIVVSIPLEMSVGSLFIALTIIYLSMFIFAAIQKENIASAISRSLRNGISSLFSNPLLVMIISLGITVLILGLIEIAQSSIGIKSGNVSGDPMGILIAITLAPVREEIGFRLVMIGLVSFLLAISTGWKNALYSLWRPSIIFNSDQYDLFRRFVLNLMLVVSSVAFGLAHIISGSGWEIGKVSEATFAGLVLGYLYIRYGLHLSILLHWGVNYFANIYAFFGQGIWGVPWNSDIGTPLQSLVLIDLFILLGLLSLFTIGYMAVRNKMKGQVMDKPI